MALDYCAGGDLALHVRQAPHGRLSEDKARFVAAELLLALEYLHQRGVIHRDVKTENVLIDAQGHVRIADMNVAKHDEDLASGGRTFTVVGTPFATAPEVLRGRGYSVAADWWSFGIVLFEMLAGRPPFPKDPALMAAQARAPLPQYHDRQTPHPHHHHQHEHHYRHHHKLNIIIAIAITLTITITLSLTLSLALTPTAGTSHPRDPARRARPPPRFRL